MDKCEMWEYILQHYKEGEYIYPAKIPSKELKVVYEQLHQLAKEHKLQEVLEIVCPECGQPSGYIYETIGKLPEQVTCPYCAQGIKNTLSHAIVIYKKRYEHLPFDRK